MFNIKSKKHHFIYTSLLLLYFCHDYGNNGRKEEKRVNLEHLHACGRCGFSVMTFGFIGAVGDGFSMPITFVITNKLVNNIGTFFSFISPQAFTKIINENVNVLCMVGAGAWVLCFLEGYCWTRTAERQASRLRNRYLKAVLRQDVSYFDLHVGSTSEVITSVSNDSLIIQNVISEKVPNFVMNTSLFVGSYVASFLLLWRLAIVGLPFIVFLIIPGLMYRRILMGLARKLTLEYNKAASISEQAISSIRTVYAFVGEPKTMSKFSTALEGSVKLGIRQGLKKIKLKGRDYATAYGFCQEILYLKKLKGKDIIIQLIDFEVTDKALLHEVMNGSISNKDSRVKDDGYIYMVLEYGEIDLAHMLSQKWREIEGTNSTMDQNWLRFYWQVGTLSYMRVMQMGILQSEIWSLGCILYQMVYGRTPFSEYKTFWAKFKVISDPSPEITYGPISNPWLLDLMKKCLAWDCNERWRIPEHPFLVPPIQQQLPPALEQNCKFTHENVPSLCLEFQQLLEDPAAISRDNQFRILSQISSICQQLQEHLTKMS